VFRISMRQAKDDADGRMSWDQTAVLIAVKGYQPYYTVKRGNVIVAADGSNTWKEGKGQPCVHCAENAGTRKCSR
jgi:pyrimidine-specific ribonucleoside hydrolase